MKDLDLERFVAKTNRMLRVCNIMIAISAGAFVFLLALPLLLSQAFADIARTFEHTGEWIRCKVENAASWHCNATCRGREVALMLYWGKALYEKNWGSYKFIIRPVHEIGAFHLTFVRYGTFVATNDDAAGGVEND